MLNVYIADLTGLEESYEEKVNRLHRERADKLNAYKMPADRPAAAAWAAGRRRRRCRC